MGACFVEVVWDGKLSRAEVKSKFDEMIVDLYQSDGNDGYNGTFTTCSGLEFCNNEFASKELAYEWLDENAQKREAVLAVRFRETTKNLVKQPTFCGSTKTDFLDPAFDFLTLPEAQKEGCQPVPVVHCCITNASIHRVGGSRDFVVHPAEQLTASQQDHLVKGARLYIEARFEHRKLNLNFQSEISDIQDVRVALSAGAWSEFKKLRKSLLTNLHKRERLADKLVVLEERYHDKLWKAETSDGEMKWMLGGVCSM